MSPTIKVDNWGTPGFERVRAYVECQRPPRFVHACAWTVDEAVAALRALRGHPRDDYTPPRNAGEINALAAEARERLAAARAAGWEMGLGGWHRGAQRVTYRNGQHGGGYYVARLVLSGGVVVESTDSGTVPELMTVAEALAARFKGA